MPIGAGPDGEGPRTRGLQAGLAVAAPEPQESETGAIALLGMRAVGQDRGHQRAGLGADPARPIRQARRRPLQVVLVRLGHVRGVRRMAAGRVVTGMRGDPLPLVETLDGRGGEPGVDDLVHERKRDGVVMPVELDVVVDVDAGRLPLAVDEGLGGQRTEGGTIQALEELAPARLVLPHHAAVEVREQVVDARVQRGQREERLMPEPRQDPALGHQHARLDFRFVPSLPGPGRQDHGAGMLGELLVGALEPGLVATGHRDAALELVWDDGAGDPAKVDEGPLVAGDPIRDLLRAGRLGVGVVRGAEDGDEEFDLAHLAGGGLDEPRLLAGVVDEALLAGAVHLAHRQAPAPEPAAVDLAELRVAVPVGMLLQVLEVEQLERHAGLAPLGVEVGAVGPGSGALARGPRRVQPGLEGLVGQALDVGPAEAGGAGPPLDPGHRPQPDTQALGHLPMGPTQGPLLAEDFADLAHGQSLGRHGRSFPERPGRRTPQRRPASGGHSPRERVACSR